MRTRRALQSAAMVAVTISIAHPAWALECPVPHPEAANGVLSETPAQIDKYSSILANGDAGNAVGIVISDLRSKFPSASNAEIANFLVAAYCPAVASQGYSGAAATEKVNAFSALVDKRLFQTGKNPAGTAAQSD